MAQANIEGADYAADVAWIRYVLPRAVTVRRLVLALGVPPESFIPNRAAATRSPTGTPVREEEAQRQGIASLRQED